MANEELKKKLREKLKSQSTQRKGGRRLTNMNGANNMTVQGQQSLASLTKQDQFKLAKQLNSEGVENVLKKKGIHDKELISLIKQATNNGDFSLMPRIQEKLQAYCEEQQTIDTSNPELEQSSEEICEQDSRKTMTRYDD